MKKILIISALSVFILSSNIIKAQENTDTKDPKAKAILDKLSSKNKSYTSIEAEFDYKLENKADGIDETQSGKILFSGNKYRLNIAGQEIVSDGTTLWTFIADADEVQISDVPEESESEDSFLNPSSIFTLYEKGFKYTYDKVETINGKSVDVIRLYPENPEEKSFHTIILKVIQENTQIQSMTIKSKDGNNFTYALKTFKPNVAINASSFKFDESSAGDVIDLR